MKYSRCMDANNFPEAQDTSYGCGCNMNMPMAPMMGMNCSCQQPIMCQPIMECPQVRCCHRVINYEVPQV